MNEEAVGFGPLHPYQFECLNLIGKVFLSVKNVIFST